MNTQPSLLKLLIPLDGSPASESALQVARYLSAKCPLEVLLLHSVEKRAKKQVHGEPHLTNPDEAQAYLERQAASLKSASTTVHTHVHQEEVSDVALSIVEHADEISPGLVVMCTHGTGPFHGLLFGSIAQKALRHGRWPVLLVPTHHDRAQSFKLEKILLPMDLAHDFEPVISLIRPLALVCSSSVHLLHVVPTADSGGGPDSVVSRYLPSLTKKVLDVSEAGAHTFLKEASKSGDFSGIEVIPAVRRGETADEIIRYSNEHGIDMTALSTHAEAGISAVVEGSVGQQVIEKSRAPLLLIKNEKIRL